MLRKAGCWLLWKSWRVWKLDHKGLLELSSSSPFHGGWTLQSTTFPPFLVSSTFSISHTSRIPRKIWVYNPDLKQIRGFQKSSWSFRWKCLGATARKSPPWTQLELCSHWSPRTLWQGRRVQHRPETLGRITGIMGVGNNHKDQKHRPSIGGRVHSGEGTVTPGALYNKKKWNCQTLFSGSQGCEAFVQRVLLLSSLCSHEVALERGSLHRYTSGEEQNGQSLLILL